MIKVLVADDHPVVRDGLRALFAEYPNIELIGEARAGGSDQGGGDRQTGRDHHGPRYAGHRRVQCDRRDQSGGSRGRGARLTMSDDDVTVTKAMRSGARGYLLKERRRRRYYGRSRRSLTASESLDLPWPSGSGLDLVPHRQTRIHSLS
jgi:DNA-binding NarL/FixJ family response regulator